MRRAAILAGLCAVVLLVVWQVLGCGSTAESRRQPYSTVGQPGGAPIAGPPGVGPVGPAGQPAAQPIVGLRMSPEEAVGAGSPYSGDWAAFVAAMVQRGFNLIVIEAVEPTTDASAPAKFYFPDVAFSDGSKLSEHGFVHADQPQVSGLLAAVAEQERQSGRQITVYADISRLALSSSKCPLVDQPLPGDELTSEQVADVVRALCAAGFDGVMARGFPEEWVARCTEAAETAQRRFLTAEGFVGESPRLAGTTGYALLDYDALDIGPRTLAFSGAAQAGREALALMSYARDVTRPSPLEAAWDSLKKAQNALRFRALVSQPAGFILDLSVQELQEIDSSLIEDVRSYLRLPPPAAEDTPKVCNVIIVGKIANRSLLRGITAIVNGITSAGFRAAFTQQPLERADAYYVLALPQGKDGSLAPLPPEIGKVFQMSSRVFLQVGGPLPDVAGSEAQGTAGEGEKTREQEQGSEKASGAGSAPPRGAAWNVVRVAFGLNNDHVEPLESVPERAAFGKVSFKFGADAGGVPFGSKLTREHLVDAEPLCLGQGELSDVVLVCALRQGDLGQKVLINGAALDIEAAFVISQLLADGGGLQEPTTALCMTKPVLALFAANGPATVKIKLGDAEAKTESFDLKDGELKVVMPPPRAGARATHTP